jgi:signal transduction histidine kinase
VFEPYARDDSNPAEVASLGLGISVAKRLARLMNGDLVLSEQDGWTVFTLLLPVALESAAAC